MNEQNNNSKEDEIIYKGNTIPKFFYVVYGAFILWAATYFVRNLWPDLLSWLNK